MRTILALFDRTAVLALGVIAGFAVGFSFHNDERGAGSEAIVPPPSAATGTPAAITPTGPAPAVSGGGTDGAKQPATAATGSAAATASVAVPPVQAPAVAHALADGTIRIGVFGDSFGDGVWAALYHQLPGKDRFKVFKFSQQATGFTRYRSLNLEDKAREQLAGQPVDIAVVSFGANDTQGVYGDDGHVYALMTPGWQRTIGARVERFVNLLRAQGAAVYWVGLPVMRKPSFDSDIQAMNAFYKARMAALGVPWIDTRPLTVDASGGYAPYLPDPQTGAPRLMRANDGIHMSMNGYERLTAGLATSIHHYADTVRLRSGAPAGPPPATPAPPTAAPLPPAHPPAKPAAATKPDASTRHDTSPPSAAAGSADEKPTNLLPPALTQTPPAPAGDTQHKPLDLPDLEENGAGSKAPANDAPQEEGKHHRKKHDDGAQAPPPGGDAKR